MGIVCYFIVTGYYQFRKKKYSAAYAEKLVDKMEEYNMLFLQHDPNNEHDKTEENLFGTNYLDVFCPKANKDWSLRKKRQ